MARALGNRPANLGKTMDDQVSRLDGAEKVTGHARYGRDQMAPGALFVGFVRCPFGSATLESCDTAPALAIDGVLEVEIDREEARYHGQPVGHVVAETPLALERAMLALEPKWNRREVKTRLTERFAEDVALEDAPAGARAALDSADHVIHAVYSTPIQVHACLETHGASVIHDGNEATVYVSSQGPFTARDGMDEALGLPQSKFRVISEYVGGGFGSKFGAGKEGMLAARIAAKYKRPAYLFVDRAADQTDTGNRPSSRTIVHVGVKKDGTILGGFAKTAGSVGAARRGGGVTFPSGRYDFGAFEVEHEDVSLNNCPPRAFRAPGHPQGAFAEELLLDEIAHATGVDPLELRLKLETDADRREMLSMGARRIGWSRREPTGSQRSTIRRGFGCGTTSWGRFPSRNEIDVFINRDGSIELRTGTVDIGTGQRTVAAVAAAKAIGVPVGRVSVTLGSTALPYGVAAGGSMTVHNSVPSMEEAARDARDKLLDAISERQGLDRDGLRIENGRVLAGGKALMEWDRACALIPGDSIRGTGAWSRRKQADDPTRGHSHGAQFVEVTVDSETGVIGVERIVAIQSCGRVMCRKTAESQIIGGVIQGLSYALFEEQVLDRNTGAMLNADLEWYRIAGSRDIPRIEPVLWTKNQEGPRSLGEPPTIPTSGAIACAVFNAIGVPVRHLPLRPDRLLDAMEGVQA